MLNVSLGLNHQVADDVSEDSSSQGNQQRPQPVCFEKEHASHEDESHLRCDGKHEDEIHQWGNSFQ